MEAVNAACAKEGLEIIEPPEDKPWGVRQMHVRHPDGHVFRVSAEMAYEHPHE